MTSLEAISTYLPPQRATVGSQLSEHGFSDNQIKMHERFYGFSEVRLDPGGGASEQLVAAVAGMDTLRGRERRVRYVLHARCMPVVAPYPRNPLREACVTLGLGHATAFSVLQHACASSLLAVDLAGKLLAGADDPDALALLITGEKAFTTSAQVLANTGVMGEGACAVLIRAGGDRDRMLSYATRTHGRFFEGPWMPPEVSAVFQDAYPGALAEVIRAAVVRAGLDVADVSLILPHNVNRMSWLRVLRLLGIRGTDRLFLDNLPRLGHCFGADCFINYESARRLGRLRPGDRYVMTAVGVGATFSAMVFEH